MEIEGILDERQFLKKPLIGKVLRLLGQGEREEYDYQGKIESISRSGPFLVFEISEFYHRRGRNDEWHQQKDKHIIRIPIEENGKFFEVSKDNYYLFYSKEEHNPNDVKIFVIR